MFRNLQGRAYENDTCMHNFNLNTGFLYFTHIIRRKTMGWSIIFPTADNNSLTKIICI